MQYQNFLHHTFTAIALLGLSAGLSLAQPPPVDPSVPQTRGPIHEAFLQPIDSAPESGMAVPKQPPPAVRELPPDEQPQGKDVQWMPGYWAWDADSSDFLWVSGFWRDAPPGRQYVPGYWTSTTEGWRWVQGFWAGEQQNSVATVPEPPAPLNTAPSIPAPDENSAYIPGSWIQRDAHYAWRPGYWSPFRPGLVWVPARYLWTPAGYVFIDGYWDLPIEDRGLLFAPVAFNGSPWLNPDWCYTPSYVVDAGILCDSSFYRPRSGHFYFGNYYGPGYATLGFRPWFTGTGRYDPAFSHYAWRQRGTPNWFAGYQQNYQARSQGTLGVPPRTFAQQTALLKQGGQGGSTALRVVTPLSQVSQLNKNMTIVKTSLTQNSNHKVAIQRSQQLVQARQHLDIVAKTGPATPSAVARTLTLPASIKTASVSAAAPAGVAPVLHASAATALPKLSAPATGAAKFTPAPQIMHTAPAALPKAIAAPPSVPNFTPGPQIHTAPAALPKAIAAPPSVPKFAPAPQPKSVPKMAAPKMTFAAPRVAHTAPAVVHSPARVTAAPAHQTAPVNKGNPPAKGAGSKHH